MKKVLKIIGIALIVVYSIVAILLTICLLNYNDYKITELGDKSLIIVKDDELIPTYKKGDLIVATKNSNKEVNKGDKIFFYQEGEKSIVINIATVVDKKNVNSKESTFTLNGKSSVAEVMQTEYFIGKLDTSKVYHNLGSVLNFLESRLGFLFLIIFPIFVLFIYEIFMVIEEIKKPDEN